MSDLRDSDPFRPPAIPVEVQCLHCGREYESYLIEWREERDADGQVQGFWCCPTPGCDGAGFGFDILPTDPEYRDERGGWVNLDDEDGEDDDFDDEFDFDDDSTFADERSDVGLFDPERPDRLRDDEPNDGGDPRWLSDDDVPF